MMDPVPSFASGWGRPPGVPVPYEGAEVWIHPRLLLAVIRSVDDGYFHMSVSHANRMPTWDEIGYARDHLAPKDIFLMVPHPPRALWLNYNPKVLHLWEMRDEKLQKIFTEEGELAQAAGYGTPGGG